MDTLLRILIFCLLLSNAQAEFKAGSALTDVTPKQLPVLVNGSMVSRSVDKIKTPVSARSLAFSDGEETLVLVVVDSCMIPRDLCDKAKTIAAGKAGIETGNILISATHTHSAPSCMGALGTDPDPAYVVFLTKKLVEAILAPLDRMEPAQIGWGEINAEDFTALRRWVLHPDKVALDPFGNPTVRANMHAAGNWDNVIGKTGPEDPNLELIAIQNLDGKPIGLLANFSMHYYGDRDISADYFGLFSNGMQELIAPEDDTFVAMMSHGCSGDIWRHDYEKSMERDKESTIEKYAEGMISLGKKAYDQIDYHRPESIAMTESRLQLDYRVPDKQLLEWSQRVVEELGDELPKTKEEIYAREQIFLHERQSTEIVVQALRLGDQISIATTPNEAYAITGLKIKKASPFDHTMTIELANGGDGYIPPPEQHLLGGYNTWAARSAGLEVQAEPKIVETAIQMLEKISGEDRRSMQPEHGPAAKHILSLQPRAYWRLDEFSGPRAIDSSPNGLDAIYEPQVLFYLPGVETGPFSKGAKNRAAHVAGDRITARVPGLTGRNYCVSLWFWSGSAPGAIKDVEWIFSRGRDYGDLRSGENVGLVDRGGGKRLLILEGPRSVGWPGFNDFTEISKVKRWTWNHLAVAREGNSVHLFLNGEKLMVHSSNLKKHGHPDTFFFGGSCSRENNFEGRIDEIALFDTPMSDDLVKEMFRSGNAD